VVALIQMIYSPREAIISVRSNQDVRGKRIIGSPMIVARHISFNFQSKISFQRLPKRHVAHHTQTRVAVLSRPFFSMVLLEC
jgi:hypothetical protein